MTTSTILPPSTPKPAEIAAPSHQESGGSPEASGSEGAPSFGQVLKSQMEKSGTEKPASEKSGTTDADDGETTAAAEGVEPARAASGSELIGLLAASQDALRQPVDFSTLASRAVAAATVTEEGGAEGPLQATTGVTGRMVATGRGGDSIADKRAAVDTKSGPDTVRFQIDETPTVRRAGPLGRALRDDNAMFEKSAVTATALTEIPTTVVPTAGSADTRRAADPADLRLTVAQPLGATGWDEAVADRVTWMTQARQPAAELHLNPPNLGPVEVRVSMQGDQATVSFFSPHAPVREALQAATPRLTEAFAASGISLGNVSVGADSQSGQDSGRRDQGRQRRSTEDGAPIAAVAAAGRWSSAIGGMRAVDLFA